MVKNASRREDVDVDDGGGGCDGDAMKQQLSIWRGKIHRRMDRSERMTDEK